MGAQSSKFEEDKALGLCRERKKFVRQAFDCRCSLAAAHVMYVQSLKNTGTSLRRFVEPEAPVESSLYTSTDATPEPLTITEKTISQFSFSSLSISQHVDATETFSPSPSPPSTNRIHANHMKFRSSTSKKVEEKPSIPVIGTVTSSRPPQNGLIHSVGSAEMSSFDKSFLEPGNSPWDYFDVGNFHPIDHQYSSQERKSVQKGFDHADVMRQPKEDKGIHDFEDDTEEISSHGGEEYHEFQESEDEFDEPAPESLVQSFENHNRVHDQGVANDSSATTMGGIASESEFLNGEKRNSSYLSPVKSTSTEVALPVEMNKSLEKENCDGSKVAPKDFFSCMKDIELLFIKASESGKEVPRMLEANKLHFRPMFPAKESSSTAYKFAKACFSCGEDPTHVPEEPAQTSVMYLTWHRTASSRSSSSRNPLEANSKDDIEDLASNLFDNSCMISGSHASTLDRLYAWERKLYDEVKASEQVRSRYDLKCRLLRQLESNGESFNKIDKTRAVVKHLHSRIIIAIHRIDSISKRIEELRDKELQPQLEELIQGLSQMWGVMFECHKLQVQMILVACYNARIRINMQSESHRHRTALLENDLYSLASSFTKWIGAQKSYLQAIKHWLYKCVSISEKSSSRTRRAQTPLSRNIGPPIYATCVFWLEKLETLPVKDVADSIKTLAAKTSHFLPHQDKNQGKGRNLHHIASWKADNGSESAANLLHEDEAPEDWDSGFEQFRSSLIEFLCQLSNFAESSVKTYTELDKTISIAKSNYDQWKAQSQGMDGK